MPKTVESGECDAIENIHSLCSRQLLWILPGECELSDARSQNFSKISCKFWSLCEIVWFLCVLGIHSNICLFYFIFMNMHTTNGSVFPDSDHRFVLSAEFSKTSLRAGSDLFALCPRWQVGRWWPVMEYTVLEPLPCLFNVFSTWFV